MAASRHPRCRTVWQAAERFSFSLTLPSVVPRFVLFGLRCGVFRLQEVCLFREEKRTWKQPGVVCIQCRLNRRPRPDAAVDVRFTNFSTTHHRNFTNLLQNSLVYWIVRAKECVFNFSFALLVYHGVNGESLEGDAPCRGYLGDGGEFRCRVRPGSRHEYRRLDETTGGSFPLLRHEGFGGRYGIYFRSI